MRFPFLLFCLSIGLNFAFSQQTVFRNIKSLDTGNGLSHNQNDYFYKDRTGFMWISSYEGLNRFDGREVKVYKPNDLLPGNIYGKMVQTPFFEDVVGNLWFTTERGINCYSKTKNVFYHFVANNDTLTEINPHRAIFLEQQRYLWLNADTMLYVFDTYSGKADIVAEFVSLNFAADTFENGQLKYIYACHWLLENGFEMLSFNENRQIVSRKTYFGGQKNGIQIANAWVESNSEVWFATNKGVLKFNPKYPNEYFISPYHNSLKNIRALNDTILLIVDAKDNLLLYNKVNKAFSLPVLMEDNKGPITVFRDVNNVFQADDIIWISLNGKGLRYFNVTPNTFEVHRIPTKDNNQSVVHIFETLDGSVGTITQTGQLNISSDDLFKQVFKGVNEFCRIYCNTNQNQFWLSTSFHTSLYSRSGRLLKKYNNNFNQNCAAAITIDNTIYIAGTDGLSRISSETMELEFIPGTGTHISCLFFDKFQNLWVGSDKNLKICQITHEGQVNNLKDFQNTGIIHQIVQCPDSDCIWIASSSGLFFYSPETGVFEKKLTNTQLDGTGCCALAVDVAGNVWIGANAGLYRYQPQTGTIDKYTTAHGLKNTEYYSGAAFRQSNGHIWMGGPNGVDVFDPENLYQRGKKPNIVLTELWVNGHLWSGDESVETAQKIDLQYFENSLTFNFAALEYTDPAHNFYKVMLEGYDTAWLNLEHKATQLYQNLPAGDYKFKVLAANAEGIWQTEPLSVDINIAKHFTATWWFRTLVAGFIIGIISIGIAFFLLFRLRAAQLNAEKQQREAEKEQMRLQQEIALRDQRDQISTSIHDDLGSGLSNIRIASERALKRFSEEIAQNTLGRIAQLAGELDENRRSLSWATDPEMDNLDSLLSRVRTDSFNIFDQTGIRFTFHAPDKLPVAILPGPYRLHLLRAIKESLNNILRHAGASETSIRVQLVKNKKLVIQISDNGTGFDPAEKKGSGKGLRAVAKHLHATGGKIEWLKNEDAGMTVRMEAPLPAGVN